MDFETAVRRRRMVRNLQSTPIPRDKLAKILELSQHAPSAGFSQGCAYVVVTEPKLRKELGKLQGEEDFYAKKRFHKFVSEAPTLVVACVSERLYHERYQEQDKLMAKRMEVGWPVPFWHFDIGCACMLIFLAAVNEGLACAFTGVFRSIEIRKLLGIPDHFQPVGVISVGYRATDVRSPSLKRGRRSVGHVVHYEHW